MLCEKIDVVEFTTIFVKTHAKLDGPRAWRINVNGLTKRPDVAPPPLPHPKKWSQLGLVDYRPNSDLAVIVFSFLT